MEKRTQGSQEGCHGQIHGHQLLALPLLMFSPAMAYGAAPFSFTTLSLSRHPELRLAVHQPSSPIFLPPLLSSIEGVHPSICNA